MTTRLAGGGGLVSEVWTWNGTDLTQFGAAVTHDVPGAPFAGTVTPTVVADPKYPSRNVLRFTQVGFAGAYWLPINGLVLPDRFVLRMQINFGTGGTGNNYAGWVNFTTDGAGVQGYCLTRGLSGTVMWIAPIIDNVGGPDSPIIAASMAAISAGRGETHRSEIWRQRGDTPAAFYVQHLGITGDEASPFPGAASGSRANAPVALTTEWDGLDFTSFGFGVTSGAALADVADIADMTIYTWPGP